MPVLQTYDEVHIEYNSPEIAQNEWRGYSPDGTLVAKGDNKPYDFQIVDGEGMIYKIVAGAETTRAVEMMFGDLQKSSH